MSLTNPNTPVSQQDLQDFYHKLLPYMGGSFGLIATGIDSANLYSTTERVIGQWIDGKPVYQKTITGTLPAITRQEMYDNTLKRTWVSIGASIDAVIDVKGFAYVKENDASHALESPIVMTPLTNNLIIKDSNGIYSQGQGIMVFTNRDADHPNSLRVENHNTYFSDMPFMATLQYTKTTDSAVESYGTDTTYSTDEHVVGSWIDGSPLYQKTIEFTVPTTYNSDVTIYTGNTNERIKYAWGALVTSTEDSVILDSPYNGTARTALHWNKNVLTSRISEWGGSNAYVTIQYTKTT